MPTIRIEYEVPKDDCFTCDYSSNGHYTKRLYCRLFEHRVLLDTRDDDTVKRCQACIDAEVKVQPE